MSSLLQLKKQREVLIVSSLFTFIHLYQLDHPYQLLGTVNDVYTNYKEGLTKLSNENVAASHYDPKCIYIVDSKTYKLIAIIADDEYIADYGSLRAFGNDSFI